MPREGKLKPMRERLPETSVKTTRPGSSARWIYVGLGVVAGGLLAGARYWYEGHLRGLAARHEWAEAYRLMNLTIRGAALFSLIVTIAFCLPVAIYGFRVLVEQRWPLSGARIEPAAVLRGRSALVRGLLILVFSLSLGGVTLYSGVLLWRGADVLAPAATTPR